MANTVPTARVIADSPSGLHREGRERDRQPGRPRKVHRGPEAIDSLAGDTFAGLLAIRPIPLPRLRLPVEERHYATEKNLRFCLDRGVQIEG